MALTKTVSVRLEIRPQPDFFPEVAPLDLAVVKGAVARFLCSLTANESFTGKVALSIAGLPAGMVGVFSLVEIGAGEISELEITTDTADVGVFDIPITFTEVL